MFAFSAGRAGSGPATWGQHAIWDVVRNLGTDAARYNVSAGGAVDPGLPVARIVEGLSELSVLHDSLRTTLHADGSGGLVQRVHESGEGVIAVRRCEPEAVADEAAALLAELAAQPFDFEHEWPARFGVIESGGLVRHMVFALSHTAVDAWGLRHLVEDMSTLTYGGTNARGLRELRPERLQPLEEAQYQASERGQRQDAAARRHWRSKLGLGPQRLFKAAGGAGLPVAGSSLARTDAGDADVVSAGAPLMWPNAQLDSPALGLALRKLVAAYAVSSSSILLAAAAAMTARLSGSEDAVFQVVVNNRFLPGLGGAVSTVAQEGIFHLPQATGEFPDLLRRAFGSSLSTYRNAYYHKASLEQDIAQLREEAGSVCDLTCFVNDIRGLMRMEGETTTKSGAVGGGVIDSALIEKARSQTALRWPIEFEPRRNVSFALDVIDGHDGSDSAGLSMTADSALIPKPQMERFLYGIEDIVIAEAMALG